MAIQRADLIPLMTAVLLVVSGCGSNTSDDAASKGSDESTVGTSGPTSEGPSESVSSSPKPALPRAADGVMLSACADGRCEVRVDSSARISVPARLQVASLRVRSIASGRVSISGRYLGQQGGGGCSGTYCSSSSGNGEFTVTMGWQSAARENGLLIEVVAVNEGNAVLRLAPN
ncbi:hypothetical protein [Streptomyces zagrosensis]|uniref:Lipoprotein n=1 Tax=Streptomyces zagrosensis TaxID=1042984 RepID=A0A7W9QDD3_9ACTN|nr:hypothetical protein [Streptomyces zagrosensis]MBB5936937.1 hypothetical protein [Streptomyces zagrosensis]